MKIKVDEISSVITEEIQNYRHEVDLSEVGRVLEVGDGIARVYGLSNAMAGELVEFSNGQFGQVFNLEENSVGVPILGDYLEIKEGDEVRRTGQLLSVPCGEPLIGRVVDPLGRPLDGKGVIETAAPAPAGVQGTGDRRAPAGERAAADRHQGDRQHDPDRPRPARADHRRPQDRQDRDRHRHDHQPEGRRRHLRLRRHRPEGIDGRRRGREARETGAMDYTIVVSASASDPAPLQYIAPYAGAAMAEYFMYNEGRPTLCVYDDLSKQAQAYRQLSLLLRRPPGREAYPGDVFYLHSRLLERAVKLRDEYAVVPSDTPADTIDRSVAIAAASG